MRNHDMWIHIFRNSCFSHFLLFWPNGVKGAILSANLSRLSTILSLSAFSPRIVGAPRLIARALAKSGAGVGCGWR